MFSYGVMRGRNLTQSTVTHRDVIVDPRHVSIHNKFTYYSMKVLLMEISSLVLEASTFSFLYSL